MSVVGNLLKEARVKRGLNIRALASSLNISLYYLQAIEEGNFKSTPGDPYTFGFVRAYASYLNLDIDLVKKLVSCLSKKRSEDYADWVDVGLCLHNMDVNFLEDYNFAKSNKYDDWLNNPKECLALIILLDFIAAQAFRVSTMIFD